MTQQNLVLLDRQNRPQRASSEASLLLVETEDAQEPQEVQHQEEQPQDGACNDADADADIDMLGDCDVAFKETRMQGDDVSRYHVYRINRAYTTGFGSQTWPDAHDDDNDDEDSEGESYGPSEDQSDESMSDDDDDDCRGTGSDDEMPELQAENHDQGHEGGDTFLRDVDMGDIKYNAVRMLDINAFIDLDIINNLINGLCGYSLLDATRRSLESWQTFTPPKGYPMWKHNHIPPELLAKLNWALNSPYRDTLTAETLKQASIWNVLVPALGAIQQFDDEELRQILWSMLFCVDTESALQVLGPQLWGLSPEEKLLLDNDALEIYQQSEEWRLSCLPQDE